MSRQQRLARRLGSRHHLQASLLGRERQQKVRRQLSHGKRFEGHQSWAWRPGRATRPSSSAWLLEPHFH